MSTYYYADQNNQTAGPVSLADLREMARRGQLAAATPVITHGSSTWSNLGAVVNEPAAQPGAEIAEAVVHHARRFQGQVQASFSEVSWGAAVYGLLLVLIQLLIEPFLIFRKGLVELTAWGQASRLPSASSDYPLPTFIIVVLRGPAIIVITLVSLGLITFFLCTGQIVPFDDTTIVAPEFKDRIAQTIWRLVITYFEIVIIGFLFDLALLALDTTQNVKKIAEKP
jgi:hypothetical protein